jgi:ABC-type cobalamin/Fe3+-siderophores transport system ATPase subunit
MIASLYEPERLGVLFVTHKVHLASRFATHAALLSGGGGIYGKSETVLTPANLVNAYGVDPRPEGRDERAAPSLPHPP